MTSDTCVSSGGVSSGGVSRRWKPRQRRLRRNLRVERRVRRSGAAAAELAVCLPVIVLLVLGTIEATNVVFLKQSLAVAAYEGGRTSVVPDATDADVIDRCNQILQDRRVQGAVVTLDPEDIEDVPVGEYIRVQVAAPCQGNTALRGRIYRDRVVTSAAVFMKEF